MGGGEKESKDVREGKSSEIDTVSQLFLHGIVEQLRKAKIVYLWF